MKTICFVVPSFPTLSQTFVTNQIIEAKKRGYKVRILTHNLESIEHSSQQKLLNEYDVINDVETADYQIPNSKFKRFFVALIYIVKYFNYWLKIPRQTARYRFINSPYLIRFYEKFKTVDVFHVHFAMGGIGIVEMKEIGLLKGKLITTFHGHDAHYKNDIELKFLQESYKELFETSDFVTVNTPYLENQILELGCDENKIRVMPMTIDVNYFNGKRIKKLPSEDKINFISIGRLIEFKGFTYAIDAIHLLVKKKVKLHYTIVGDGELFGLLHEQIKKLELQDHISLVGRRSQDEIKELLDQSHIYLMSSIQDSNNRTETQGVVTAEAQAMGLPVVAFASGGVPYTMKNGQTGFLVEEKNIEEYAKAILELIDDSELYQKMSHQARIYIIDKFSNDTMFPPFVDLYES